MKERQSNLLPSWRWWLCQHRGETSSVYLQVHQSRLHLHPADKHNITLELQERPVHQWFNSSAWSKTCHLPKLVFDLLQPAPRRRRLLPHLPRHQHLQWGPLRSPSQRRRGLQRSTVMLCCQYREHVTLSENYGDVETVAGAEKWTIHAAVIKTLQISPISFVSLFSHTVTVTYVRVCSTALEK